MKILSDLWEKFGLWTLFVPVTLAIIIWGFAHWTAQPGTQVSVLWGAVEYTKSASKKDPSIKVASKDSTSVKPPEQEAPIEQAVSEPTLKETPQARPPPEPKSEETPPKNVVQEVTEQATVKKTRVLKVDGTDGLYLNKQPHEIANQLKDLTRLERTRFVKQYPGKRLRIHGPIDRISRPFYRRRSSSEHNPYTGFTIVFLVIAPDESSIKITVTMKQGYESKLSKLQSDDVVTIDAKIKSISLEGNITLENGELVSVEE